MIIGVTGVPVDDQEKAMKFYTEVLGFQIKYDMPLGNPEGDRWLTVVSPERPDGVELLLEPNRNPITIAFQEGLMEQGFPAIIFNVDDIQAEYERLSGLGVAFMGEPTDIGPAIMAIFNDTCGNLIQIMQEKGG
ncbi:MAG: VOC family protein [Chloroflexi bacterium]|nr:VOC family protein [Chloroflexota bacterium]